tara:strand:+ start:2223 stop:2993 length:771 start_codon:yes stop_codon:yes gene_type:complete
MNLNLKKKLFIVSGSTKGIGLRIAEELLKEEAKVIINGRNEESFKKNFIKLKKTFSKRVYFVFGDINDNKTLSSMRAIILKNNRKLDGLIANAGSISCPYKNKNSKQSYKWYYKNNYLNTVKFVNFFINILKKNRSSIVFISSIASIKKNLKAPKGFKDAKLSINNYSDLLAKKLAKYNVRVNTVLPGNIYVKNGSWDIKMKKNKKKIKKMIKNNVPLIRFGTAKEVANSVAFLISDLSGFTTGAKLVIDGGQSLK